MHDKRLSLLKNKPLLIRNYVFFDENQNFPKNRIKHVFFMLTNREPAWTNHSEAFVYFKLIGRHISILVVSRPPCLAFAAEIGVASAVGHLGGGASHESSTRVYR